MVETRTLDKAAASALFCRARKRQGRDAGAAGPSETASQNLPPKSSSPRRRNGRRRSNDKNDGEPAAGPWAQWRHATRAHADRRAASVAPGRPSARLQPRHVSTRLPAWWCGSSDNRRWRRRSISCTNCVATCAAGVHAPHGEAGCQKYDARRQHDRPLNMAAGFPSIDSKACRNWRFLCQPRPWDIVSAVREPGPASRN